MQRIFMTLSIPASLSASFYTGLTGATTTNSGRSRCWSLFLPTHHFLLTLDPLHGNANRAGVIFLLYDMDMQIVLDQHVAQGVL
jgi:hypothetical protein